MKKPTRAFEVSISIGGDTEKDVIAELAYLLYHLRLSASKNQLHQCDSLEGGPTSYHQVKTTHDPAMTNALYHEQLRAYLKERDGK